MVNDSIQHNPDSSFVGFIYQFTKISRSAKIRIQSRPVFGPVSMKTVGITGSFISSTVNLLYHGSHPDGIYTQFSEVSTVYFLDNPAQVSSFKTAEYCSFFGSVKIDIISSITIMETVCEQEIYIGSFPDKRLPGGFLM